MPAGYPRARSTSRGPTVTRSSLDGPTYFTSGVYYFQNTVTVAAGADVVVGMGRNFGCTTDQEAVFYATNAPADAQHLRARCAPSCSVTSRPRHRWSSDRDQRRRLDRLRFNQRYVAPNDAGGQPSFGVSIVSVNGKAISGPDAKGSSNSPPLDVPGVERRAGIGRRRRRDPEIPPTPAGQYRLPAVAAHPRATTSQPPRWDPATATVELRTGTGATDGAVRVRWQEPERLGGMPVDEYVVTASPGWSESACRSACRSSAWCTGLTNNTQYTFTVTRTERHRHVRRLGRERPGATTHDHDAGLAAGCRRPQHRRHRRSSATRTTPSSCRGRRRPTTTCPSPVIR